MEPETIKINEVEYIRKDAVKPLPTGKIRIAILQRGWVAVGYYHVVAEKCFLEKASVIRIWGTTKGLGEIALNGPTAKTLLDPCGRIQFHELTAIALLDCVEEKWINHLL